MTDSHPTSAGAAPGRDVPPLVDPAEGLAVPEPPRAGQRDLVSGARSTSGFPPPSEPVPALADVIARPVKSSGRGGSLLMALAAAIAIGGLAFAAGRFTAPASAAGSGGTGQVAGNGQVPGYGQFPANGNGQGFAGRADGFGGISLKGTVSSVSADSITVKLASGTEETIPLDSSTTYHTATTSTSSAVAVGSTVTVTPGARIASPNASLDPNASPRPAGGLSFGAATDVTVTAP